MHDTAKSSQQMYFKKLLGVIDTVESDPRLVQLYMSLVDLKGKMRYNPLMGEHINCD